MLESLLLIYKDTKKNGKRMLKVPTFAKIKGCCGVGLVFSNLKRRLWHAEREEVKYRKSLCLS